MRRVSRADHKVKKKGNYKVHTSIIYDKNNIKISNCSDSPQYTDGALSFFSETHIVKAVSTDSNGEVLKTSLRSGLGVSSVIIFALSYWICDLKEQFKINKNVSHDKLKLEEENEILKLKIEEQQKAINTLSKTTYDAMRHSKPRPSLDNQKINILVYLAGQHNSVTAESIATFMVIHLQTVLFHLHELKDLNMADVSAHIMGGAPNNWTITQNGRKYLSQENLLP